MLATGAAWGGVMRGTSRNMMIGMSAIGVIWTLAALAVIIALIVLLVRGVTRV